MKKLLLVVSLSFITFVFTFAQEVDSIEFSLENIEESLHYQTGQLELESGNASLTVPEGFRFLDRMQSIYVLTELWGNPPDSSILGMLVPKSKGVMDADGWVFTISFDDMGFVKDDDAEDINYDDLLEEQQQEFSANNPARIEEGYQPIDFIGWASDPFYDKDKKILHWAKELKFGDDTQNTLNYNLRVLGRKGVFVINAIATMREFNEVESNINKVLASIEYNDGHRYGDFLPEVDNVAAWTVGGLVAGKVLSKIGIFAILLKSWKLIFFGILAAGGTVWKFITGKKDNDTPTLG